MNLLEQIIARFGALFPGVSLSKARLAALSKALSAQLEAKKGEGGEVSESDIDSALKDADKFYPFSEIAKQDEALRQAKTELSELKKKKPGDEEKAKESEEGADPFGLKSLLDAALAPLKQELTALKTSKANESRETTLREKLKEAGASETLIEKAVKDFNKMKFETDEDFADHLGGEVEFAKTFAKTSAEQKATEAGPPVFGKTNAAGVSANTAAYIESRKKLEAPAGKTVFPSN